MCSTTSLELNREWQWRPTGLNPRGAALFWEGNGGRDDVGGRVMEDKAQLIWERWLGRLGTTGGGEVRRCTSQDLSIIPAQWIRETSVRFQSLRISRSVSTTCQRRQGHHWRGGAPVERRVSTSPAEGRASRGRKIKRENESRIAGA